MVAEAELEVSTHFGPSCIIFASGKFANLCLKSISLILLDANSSELQI